VAEGAVDAADHRRELLDVGVRLGSRLEEVCRGGGNLHLPAASAAARRHGGDGADGCDAGDDEGAPHDLASGCGLDGSVHR
jgi:hypothetical protein